MKGYFMAKNSFVADVTFNFLMHFCQLRKQETSNLSQNAKLNINVASK